MPAALLTTSSISKRFGATRALVDVSFSVSAGEVHALIGENGAGKSTLMKTLAGVHRPDSGAMQVAGREYRPLRPADAQAAGVAMIHQELNLAPHLSVEANIMLGQERHRAGWVRRGEHRELARRALGRLSYGHLPLDLPVGHLPIAAQQIVEIARALVSRARVIIFDEPTSSLTEQDTEHLFGVIRQLRDEGLGIVYISHFLEEVAQICDVYTVLRDGATVGSGRLEDVSADDIVALMVGRQLDELFPNVPHQPGEPLLEIHKLSGRVTPRDIDLEVRRGEILGVAGLVGAGRSQLVRCVFGLAPVVAGSVRVVHVGPVGVSPRRSIRSGLALLSENRKDEGLALNLSIVDNLTLTRLAPYSIGGWLNLRRRRAATEQWIDRVGCKTSGPQQPVGQLSGGNQQKIAFARLLHQDADLYLLDEPTRGIDIATKAQLYRMMGQLAADGKAVVLVSSYLPELLNVCDRVAVMSRGQLRDVRKTDRWTEESVMHCATLG